MTLGSVEGTLAAVGSADLVVPYHATPWKRAWYRRMLTWIAVTELNVLNRWRLRLSGADGVSYGAGASSAAHG